IAVGEQVALATVQGVKVTSVCLYTDKATVTVECGYTAKDTLVDTTDAVFGATGSNISTATTAGLVLAATPAAGVDITDESYIFITVEVAVLAIGDVVNGYIEYLDI
ncbi:MAG: hypothetical protein ACXABY_17260, partial [Candidatus Thorarchaeota archaeon]